MNNSFFAVAFLMSLFATFFLVRPLVTASPASNRGNARLPLLIVIIAIILGVGLYGVLGRPNVPSTGPHAKIETSSSNPQATASKTDGIAPVGSLLTGLEQRLLENPDDAKGWLLLAKSYQHLGKNEEAAAAYEKAAALGQVDAAFADSLDASEINAQSGIEIRGRVSLSEAARAVVQKDDIVFVFARAENGPPMPLAVVQRPASELPFEFVLNDASSMVQGSGLSGTDAVIVTAKISAPGNALSKNLDLQVKSDPIAAADAPYLDLVIGSTQ